MFSGEHKTTANKNQEKGGEIMFWKALNSTSAVSYTHLDVYKRQVLSWDVSK